MTDGETNATLPKGSDPATVTPERALELLQATRAAGPSKKKPVRRKAAVKSTKTLKATATKKKKP